MALLFCRKEVAIMSKKWIVLLVISSLGLLVSLYGIFWQVTNSNKPGLAETMDSRCFPILAIIFSIITIIGLIKLYKSR